jgi:hypothetical protein
MALAYLGEEDIFELSGFSRELLVNGSITRQKVLEDAAVG